MTSPVPAPQPGELNWAVPLNNYINEDAVVPAAAALLAVNTHIAGIAPGYVPTTTDPHGDQAYARALVNAITSGANQANGFAQLDGSGHLPVSVVPIGSLQSDFFDVVNDYNVVPNGGNDVSAALNTILADAGNAGGGEVWVGDGVFSVGSALIVPSNVWLHLSPGCVLRRITPASGPAPAQMICNVAFSTTTPGTPGGGNIKISGGSIDATGNNSLTSACVPVMLVQVNFATINETAITAVAASPAVELNGSSNVTLRDCYFTGATLTAAGSQPAVRLSSTSTGVAPAGLSAYNNATCQNIMVDSCFADSFAFNRFLGCDTQIAAPSFLHSMVTVTGCGMGSDTFTATPPTDGTYINQLDVFGNQFYGEDTLDLTTTGSVGTSPSFFMGNGYSGGPNVNAYVAGLWKYATGVQGAYTPETWHTVSLGTGWSGQVQYMFLPIGNGVVAFKGTITAGAGVTTTIGTLPAPYFNSGATSNRWTVINLTSSTDLCYCSVSSSGVLSIGGGALGTDQFDISGIAFVG